MDEKFEPAIAFSIEDQLKSYCEAKRHTERHEIMWHAWNQNRRWLSQLLELTLPAFPNYSRHDESHSKSVIQNMEKILGEERIRQLSATDCFMLLHVAYIHDLGMCITADDRKKILSDENFVEMIDHISEEGDESLRRAAKALQQTIYPNEDGLNYADRLKCLNEKYSDKLDVYYAIVYLMAEYQRKSHGSEAKSRMHSWTMNSDQLGTGFSMSGIPLRLFLRIADCAALHTDWEFSHILDLPAEDSGYANDMMHPRFVAVMLQLGDALDIDNDRFHLFTKYFVGELPEQSENHFQKHQAIRQLKISPEEIRIEADCNTQEALRLVRSECDAIENILKSASYHWSEISPKELNGCLPTMRPLKIKLQGRSIPKELVTAKFNISQTKAFQLLEGANIYFGEFTFLRELLQNAIDATKLQCWRDYNSKRAIWNKEPLFDISEVGFNELVRQLNVSSYPIELRFEIVAKLHTNCGDQIIDEYIPIEDIEKYRDSDVEVGVLLSVRDYGTGISKTDLTTMTDVGSSYSVKKRTIYRMPEWLQPTGQFGIGLQSVFLVCHSFVAYTRTHNDERYEINFNSAVHQNGYINAKPIESIKNENYGTTFEVFVSCNHKLLHKQCMDAWNLEDVNSDRFSEDYDLRRRIRHSQELLTQMIVYIDGQIGESIFPTYVYVKNVCIDNTYMEFIKKNTHKVYFDSPYENVAKYDNLPNYVSWMFGCHLNQADESYVEMELENGKCRLDLKKGKFHIWNTDVNVAATIGIDRLIGKSESTKIYLKGIFLREYNFQNDAELLESIDIKSSIKKEYININRNELTDVGLQFLDKIYEHIMKTVRTALELLANDSESCKKILNIIEVIKEDPKNNLDIAELQRKILFVSCLAFYAKVEEEKDYKIYINKKHQNCLWDDVLENVGDLINENEERLATGLLKKIPVYNEDAWGNNDFGERFKKGIVIEKKLRKSFPELLKNSIKVGVISRRENSYSNWVHHVVEISENTYSNLTQKLGSVWSETTLIEDAGNDLLDAFILKCIKSGEKEIHTYDLENQTILKWMLTNVPTYGIWATEDGNIRLNVLSTMLPHTIFYNKNMKYLMLKRMEERCKQGGGKRYMTLTWKKYESLRLKVEPSSVCFISRGYLNRNQKSRMLLPILGSKIEGLLNICVDEEMKDIKNILERYLSYFDIVNQFEKYAEDFKGGIEPQDIQSSYGYFYRKMKIQENPIRILGRIADDGRKFIFETYRRCESNQKSLADNTEYNKERITSSLNKMPSKEQVYLFVLKKYFGDMADLEIQMNLEKSMIFVQHRLFKEHKNLFMQQEKVVKLKTEIFGESNARQRMIQYVSDNSYGMCSLKEIEVLYEALLEDLIDVVYSNKIKIILKEFNTGVGLELHGERICVTVED